MIRFHRILKASQYHIITIEQPYLWFIEVLKVEAEPSAILLHGTSVQTFFFFRAKPSPMLLILRLKDIFLIKLSIMCVLDYLETPVSYAAIESAFWRPPMIH